MDTNIQRYWSIYLKATDPVVQKDLDTDIQTVMNEINLYLDEHDLTGAN